MWFSFTWDKVGFVLVSLLLSPPHTHRRVCLEGGFQASGVGRRSVHRAPHGWSGAVARGRSMASLWIQANVVWNGRNNKDHATWKRKKNVVRSTRWKGTRKATTDGGDTEPLITGSGGGADGGEWGYGGGDGGRSGGDGDGTSGDGPQPKGTGIEALLLAAGRSLDTIPADLAAGARAGKLQPEILERFFRLENSLLGPLMKIDGFRERLLADPGFFVKVGIEVGIGVACKITAEYEKRKGHFAKELDFVFANMVMALIADFMLVWLPAPTYSFKAASKTSGRISQFLANCPDNAFQKVPAGMQPFTLGQRSAAVLRNGVKLLGVGMFSSLFGVTITNVLQGLRTALDPTFVPQNPPQDILITSLIYGSYMASSSNLRYQILAGVIEERGIEVLFKGDRAKIGALCAVLRTLNTFLGSLMWVDYIRMFGYQKSGE